MEREKQIKEFLNLPFLNMAEIARIMGFTNYQVLMLKYGKEPTSREFACFPETALRASRKVNEIIRMIDEKGLKDLDVVRAIREMKIINKHAIFTTYEYHFFQKDRAKSKVAQERIAKVGNVRGKLHECKRQIDKIFGFQD
jgi:hypothetical protein